VGLVGFFAFSFQSSRQVNGGGCFFTAAKQGGYQQQGRMRFMVLDLTVVCKNSARFLPPTRGVPSLRGVLPSLRGTKQSVSRIRVNTICKRSRLINHHENRSTDCFVPRNDGCDSLSPWLAPDQSCSDAFLQYNFTQRR
jgi:hypothetical protein